MLRGLLAYFHYKKNTMGLFDLFKSKPKTENTDAEKSEPKVSFEVLRDDGVRAMKMGEVPFAVKCFTAALEMKDDLTTLSYLAEAQIRMQDYEKARPSLERLVEAAPENLTLILLLARTLGELKDYATMKTIAEKALALESESSAGKYYAADAAYNLGDPFTAIALLTQALEKHADFADARSLRARILMGMQQFQEAVNDTEILVAENAENEEYLAQHAQVLTAIDRDDEAIDTLLKLKEYNPFNREAVVLLCGVYEKKSLHDKALELLDEAIELQPDFGKAYKIRGGIKLHLNDKEGAAADLTKSLEVEPELAKEVDGEYTTLENQLKDRFRSMNPYQF